MRSTRQDSERMEEIYPVQFINNHGIVCDLVRHLRAGWSVIEVFRRVLRLEWVSNPN